MVTAAELALRMKEGEFAPSLEDWNYWRIDSTNYMLVGIWYEVDLERCCSSAEVLDWIIQISQKGWATPDVLSGLIHSLGWILDPQRHLCSFGANKRITKKALRQRVDKLVRLFPQTTIDDDYLEGQR
jgi:hypothetical protein